MLPSHYETPSTYHQTLHIIPQYIDLPLYSTSLKYVNPTFITPTVHNPNLTLTTKSLYKIPMPYFQCLSPLL